MLGKGGLPAIGRYEIERHWWLHELRRLRAMQRVHGREFKREIKQFQKELCNVRSQTH